MFLNDKHHNHDLYSSNQTNYFEKMSIDDRGASLRKLNDKYRLYEAFKTNT